MKILAIRGQNLASLAHAFEIDFRQQPLASAGLFAITGPTGSGKSTLLDALCIALYERTPRLGKAPNRNETIPDVGEERLSASDPRTLLRRGAGEGWAEVDFVGSDGLAYRTRWSVRRARGRATGRLQASEFSLLRLSDQQLLSATHKTDTLKMIEERIGLSYEQFTRAVLLAQNEFATFLKASTDERAELLQTLTGTETYTRISRQAFERMKAEQGRLQALEQQLQAIAPLPPEQRSEKEGALAAASAQVKGLEAQKQHSESRLRWHQQLAQLLAEETEARQALAAASAARLAADGRAQQLARVERVQPARGLVAELDRLQAARVAADKSLATARAALAGARQRLALSEAEAAAAAQGTGAREEAQAAAQPALNEARRLDGTLSVARQHVQEAVAAHEAAVAEHAQAMHAQAQAQHQRAQTEKALAATQAWLDEHMALRPLAQGWAAWETRFEHARQLRDQAQQLDTARTDAQRQVQALESAMAAARACRDEALAKLADARQALEAQARAVLAFDPESLAAARRSTETRREQLAEAARLWQKLQQGRSQRQDLEQETEALGRKLQDAGAGRDALMAARPGLESRHDMARSLCARARLAASDSAERLRAQLEPGRECPVCGALDHPYAAHSPREKAMLDSLQAAEDEARDELARVDGELHALAARLEADTEARERIDGRRLALDQELQVDEASWCRLALHRELVELAEQDRLAWLEQARRKLEQEIEALDQAGAHHREALRAKDLAQAGLDTATLQAGQAGQACAQLESDHAAAAAERTRLDAGVGELRTRLDEQLDKLDAAFAGRSWRRDWEGDAAGFVAHCAAEVGRWNGRQAEVDALGRTLEQLTTTLAGMDNSTHQLGSRVQTLHDRRRREDEGLAALEARRAALLDGRAVTEVESTLAAALSQARALAEQTRQAHQAAVSVCAQREAETHQGEELARQLDDAAQHAEQALQAWIGAWAAQGPDDAPGSEELRRLLAHDDTWLAGERAALARLEQAVSSAQAVLEARQTTRSRHQTDSPAAEDADTLQASLDSLSAQLASAHTLLTTLKVELARDDSRRQESDELRRQLDRQGACARVWSQLGELIGSADGKKFRNYAQQLTLDILLGYANRHLENLARRYRLMRIEDSLGLLVIDQEMGDETRSVHSLSGGESFLVSLSLALGLASLSSHRVRVESLFIDEGFGSLDAEALNVAMEALDRLQALGRKVGIISHVQEMTERIGTRIQVSRQSGGLSRVALSCA